MIQVQSKQEVHVVPKGWGTERWIRNDELYCLKELHIVKNGQCSYHYHNDKTETFLLVEGCVRLELSPTPGFNSDTSILDNLNRAEVLIMRPGDAIHIPPGVRHRFTGLRMHNLIIEASTFHRDEDSICVVGGDSQHGRRA